MLYGFNALVGAVRFGLERAMLCAAEAASSMASGGYGARVVKWAIELTAHCIQYEPRTVIKS